MVSRCSGGAGAIHTVCAVVWQGRDSRCLALEEEIAEQRRKINLLTDRNRALEAEVIDLKSGLAAIEERARTELGMVGRGEVFYQVVEPQESIRE